MRKRLFQEISHRIATGDTGGEVVHVGLWNNNIDYLSSGGVFPTPAVFVEFEEIEWRQAQNGVRTADVGIRLHMVTQAVALNDSFDERVDDALFYLELLDTLVATMHGFGGEGFASFQHTASYTNHDHGELIDSVERFVTRVQDTSATVRWEQAQIKELAVTRRE